MDYAVIGGDARFVYLTQLLRSEGYDARAVNGFCGKAPAVPWADESELAWTENAVMNWPLPEGMRLLESMSPGTHVFFCGPGVPEGIPEKLTWTDLWKDERLTLENAYLTAEGAVSSAMTAGARSMKDCRCLVIGWGRIGRALTEILVGLNAHVTVASRSQQGRNCAAERGAESVPTEEIAAALQEADVVFSTAPSLVLGEKELKRAKSGVIVIDLASAPYGVDLGAAEKLGVRAWLEPKLPGRYCPLSAAMALKRAIDRAKGALKYERTQA